MKIPAVVLLSIWSLLTVFTDEQGELINLRSDCNGQSVTLRCQTRAVDGKALRQLLEAGDVVVFRYETELRRERGIWFDEFLDEAVLDKRLSYNHLTHQYYGMTTADGQEASTLIFGELDAALGWLTALDDPPLVLQAGGPLKPDDYLQARVVLKRKKFLLLIPLETATPWKRQPVQCP